MVTLAAMRYKDYVWPHNPRTYTIDYERSMAVQKVPFGRYELQDMGLTQRVMKGEGEFVGAGAYDEFKKLAAVFYLSGAGPLLHPVWQAAEVYFVDLRLKQEPRGDYVSYVFTFWETGVQYEKTVRRVEEEANGPDSVGGESTEPLYHTVRKGESLWVIAREYGVDLNRLIGLNPQIKSPNLIMTGERVRVR